MEKLRISATSHGHNYLPEYYAQSHGLFASRGLEVQSWPQTDWHEVITDLVSGSADIVLGGLWVPAMYFGRGLNAVVVGQLNARFSKVVVTREPVDSFGWDWMRGKTVLVPGAGGGASYLFMAGLMRASGVSESETTFVRDLPGAMLTELFVHGLGDAIVLDTFSAVALLSQRGVGHVSYRFAHSAGPMANSVYYTLPERLPELQGRLAGLLAGVQQAMDAIMGGAPTAELLAEHWPKVPSDVLADATAALVGDGTWTSVVIDPEGCDRWIGMLRDGGALTTDIDYERLVDTRAMEACEADGESGAARLA